MHDVDEHNGCMMFVPGSHTKGTLTGIDLVNPQDIFAFEESNGVTRTQAVKVPLKAGSLTFHNGLCFHYAHANMSDQPRRVLRLFISPMAPRSTATSTCVPKSRDRRQRRTHPRWTLPTARHPALSMDITHLCTQLARAGQTILALTEGIDDESARIRYRADAW
jgi:ectoine hydroxylase-related dioxygenase (phytanoyl-CoA dioxygenase family)